MKSNSGSEPSKQEWSVLHNSTFVQYIQYSHGKMKTPFQNYFQFFGIAYLYVGLCLGKMIMFVLRDLLTIFIPNSQNFGKCRKWKLEESVRETDALYLFPTSNDARIKVHIHFSAMQQYYVYLWKRKNSKHIFFLFVVSFTLLLDDLSLLRFDFFSWDSTNTRLEWPQYCKQKHNLADF